MEAFESGWGGAEEEPQAGQEEGDPEVLPYYMNMVENGYAGTRKRGLRNLPEEEDIFG